MPLANDGGLTDLCAIIDAIKAAVVETLAIPQLLDGVQAQNYVGLSKSSWHRARSAGVIPPPVFVDGAGDRYRRADLDRAIERLKPRRRTRARAAE